MCTKLPPPAKAGKRKPAGAPCKHTSDTPLGLVPLIAMRAPSRLERLFSTRSGVSSCWEEEVYRNSTTLAMTMLVSCKKKCEKPINFDTYCPKKNGASALTVVPTTNKGLFTIPSTCFIFIHVLLLVRQHPYKPATN